MDAIMIPVHAVAALVVISIGPVQIFRQRRDRRHRWIGRGWVVAMYLTCSSGMFIYSIGGGLTLFHALAVFTFFTTTLGLINARRGHYRAHAGNMIGGYLGAVVAGLFAAVVPNRWIPSMAVESPALLWSVVVGAVAVSTLWLLVVMVRIRPAPRADRARADIGNSQRQDAPVRNGRVQH